MAYRVSAHTHTLVLAHLSPPDCKCTYMDSMLLVALLINAVHSLRIRISMLLVALLVDVRFKHCSFL